MQLVPVPRESYGTFFKGDTYIIFANSENMNSKVISQHIHLWIGADSTTVRKKFYFNYSKDFPAFYMKFKYHSNPFKFAQNVESIFFCNIPKDEDLMASQY